MTLFTLKSPDARLVHGARAGETDAFETLVQRYQRKAHAVARATGVRLDSLDDVAQEAFLQAFRQLKELRSPEAFGAWFLKIVRNLALKERERSRRSPSITDLDQLTDPRSTNDVEHPVDRRDLNERLWREVDQLSPDVREAILLYYYDGESTRRVAQVLGVSRTAVKSRLLRGRDALRGRLWHELRQSLCDELPSRREWRRRGRQLTLLIVATRASGTAGAASRGGPSVSATGSGAIGVDTTQLAIVVTFVVVGGMGAWYFMNPPGEPSMQSSLTDAHSSRTADAHVTRVVDGPPIDGRATTQSTPQVSGTVVFRDDGAPAADANVAMILDGAREHAAVTKTDAAGQYQFESLAPGRYRTFFWRETWTTHGPYEDGRFVELGSGIHRDNVDGWLVPGVSIQGEVVREITGEPISGAALSAGWIQFTHSGADGRFTLEGVPSGSLHLLAAATGCVQKWLTTESAPGVWPSLRIELAAAGQIEGTVLTAGGQPAGGVTVSARGATQCTTDSEGQYFLGGVPFGATRVFASVDGTFATQETFPGFPPGETRARLDFQLQAGQRLAGHVVDQAGEPVESVEIKLGGRVSPDREYETDANGNFTIEGVTEHVFSFSLKKPGFAPKRVVLRDFSAAELTALHIEFHPGRSLAGVVVDATGQPIANAWVHASSPHSLGESTTTDKSGSFRIMDLPVELERIRVSKRGFTDLTHQPVEADVDDVRLVLMEAGLLHGVVVDGATGQPVTPYTLKVSSARGKYHALNRAIGFVGLNARLGRVGRVCGHSNGAFRINEVAPERFYDLVVQADGYTEAILNGVEAWPLSVGREPILIELRRGETLAGRVFSRATGEVMANVRVSHLREAPGYELWDRHDRGDGRAVRVAWTDAEGAFRLHGVDTKPGVLLLEKDGFARTTVFGVSPSDEGQRFELGQAAIIEGRIQTADGVPRNSVSVDVEINDQRFYGGDTDAHGVYRIEGLPDGTTDVITRRRDGLKRRVSVKTRAGEITTLDLGHHPGVLSGEFTRGGEPIPDASIYMKYLGDTHRQCWVRTDGGGSFHVDGLLLGTYEVRAFLPGPGFSDGIQREVQVTGADSTCSIELEPPTAITGSVVDGINGAAANGFRVMLYRSSDKLPGLHWILTGNDQLEADENEFHFEVAQASEYLVVASRSSDAIDVGWLGPMNLIPGQDTAPLEILVGGSGTLNRLSARRGNEPSTPRAECLPQAKTGISVCSQRDDGCRRDRNDPWSSTRQVSTRSTNARTRGHRRGGGD